MEAVTPLAGFRARVEIPARFRDTDAMGHVNNAVYLSYLEEARFEYARRALGVTRHEDVGFIVARVEIDYKSPARFGESLSIGARVSRLGGASFTMEYKMIDAGSSRLVAEAKSVQVSYDYKAGKVRPLTEDFKNRVRKFDGLA